MKHSSMGPAQDCARAWELMPWVLQGNASQEDQDWLLEHQVKCAACSAEFALQSRLRVATSLPSDLPVDPEAGLQRLFAQIDAARPRRAPSGNGWALKALAAAVLAQAIGLGVLGTHLATSSRQAPEYRTLSDAPAAPAGGVGTIRVVPDPQMALADWDALLHTLHLQVVGGPNGIGAYSVAPADAATAAPAAQTVQQLRAVPGIRLAEPIAAAP